jgi:hypothetical protein
VCARTPKATTPTVTLSLPLHLVSLSSVSLFLLLLCLLPHLSQPSFFFSSPQQSRTGSALSLPPPRSLATSSPLSSPSFALSCVGPAPWGSRRSSSWRRFGRCCCGEMVRRITRCCDTEQVGCPGLSFSLLRSVGRSSWGAGGRGGG